VPLSLGFALRFLLVHCPPLFAFLTLQIVLQQRAAGHAVDVACVAMKDNGRNLLARVKHRRGFA
jgi:ABC-type microcin C transport system permease subunit YejB